MLAETRLPHVPMSPSPPLPPPDLSHGVGWHPPLALHAEPPVVVAETRAPAASLLWPTDRDRREFRRWRGVGIAGGLLTIAGTGLLVGTLRTDSAVLRIGTVAVLLPAEAMLLGGAIGASRTLDIGTTLGSAGLILWFTSLPLLRVVPPVGAGLHGAALVLGALELARSSRARQKEQGFVVLPGPGGLVVAGTF